MDREIAIAELKKCQASADTEGAHYTADLVLCDLLVALGYGDVVEEWENFDKWYA